MLFFYGSTHKMRRRPIELSTYWERSTFEYATTLFDEIDLDGQNYHRHQQLLIPLLTRLHTLLPPELRDIIYTHIIAHGSQIYTFQPPNLLFRLDIEMPVAPVSLIPRSLLKMEHLTANTNHPSRSHTDPSAGQAPLAALAALTVSELTAHVLRAKTWFLRYRYNGALLEFVRDPGVYIVGAAGRALPEPAFKPNAVPVPEPVAAPPAHTATETDLTTLPAHQGPSPAPPFTHLQILISPPPSPEDDSCYDEEFEYPWSFLFPSPRNSRCAELRAQLYRDMCALADLVGPDCRVELLVYVGCDDETRDLLGEEGEGGMRGFLRGVGEVWRERGRGRGFVVRWVDAAFEEADLERLGV